MNQKNQIRTAREAAVATVKKLKKRSRSESPDIDEASDGSRMSLGRCACEPGAHVPGAKRTSAQGRCRSEEEM